MTNSKRIIVFCVLVWFSIAATVKARDGSETFSQKELSSQTELALAAEYAAVNHRIGKLVLGLQNDGELGIYYDALTPDYFTGEKLLSCEYPKGSNTRYLCIGAFWIGAVVGRDTLVSTATTGWYNWGQGEFSPEAPVVKRSMAAENFEQRVGAVSEEDYIMVYTDTRISGIEPDFFGQPFKPLNVEVTQASYAWSYSYAEDFILFDYKVCNIGTSTLEEVYMGFYIDADVMIERDDYYQAAQDDICGFVATLPTNYLGCEFLDTVNIAWIADNDGDPIGGAYTDESAPSVTGMRVVRTPADSLDISFNWWISNESPLLDFGPREREGVGRLKEDFRDFGTGGIGTPMGDANMYYQMRNMEFDYDQIYTGQINVLDTLWLYPNQDLAADFADGFDTRYLLSFGPFDIDPGETLPISFAYIAGEDFHKIPSNIDNLPNRPDLYYDNVSFADLGLNATWAAKVYDNPGYDTDGDGYAGKLRICCGDSLGISLDDIDSITTVEFYNPSECEWAWYEGDGVPDFRGASPPPAPQLWLIPQRTSIHVRFNGIRSETTRDLFSGLMDFEGYRVYIGRDDRASSYTVVASYDKEDYNKYVLTSNGYRLFDVPFTIDSLRCLYGLSCEDSLFNPLLYTADNPFRHPMFADSIFYFEKQDYNVSEFGVQTMIKKTYPTQPYPSSLSPDSAASYELTEDGYFKYFEYECTIDNLMPTVPYWINVTAFDFGSPVAGLEALESSVTLGAKEAFTGATATDVESEDLKVYVYPNPYRSDADYRDEGFEGRTDNDRPDCRVRRINFSNLPAKCTIRIYSLDGDLVRELDHDRDPGDPTSSHDSWNLITRNTQMVASGLYYWTVEADDGTVQLGKLVIIL